MSEWPDSVRVLVSAGKSDSPQLVQSWTITRYSSAVLMELMELLDFFVSVG